VQARGGAHGDPQSRTLHYRPLDHFRDGICCISSTDHGQSLDRGGLFGYCATRAEPSEAAAQGGKRRNGRSELPAPRFHGEFATIRKIRFNNRTDQCLVRHAGWHHAALASRGTLLYRTPVREKIELLFRHRMMMRRAGGVLNQQRMIPTEIFL